MTAGQNTKMLRGAIWACALPVGLGVWGLILEIRRLPQRMSWEAFLMDFQISLPVVFCFIFGTPLAAWLACCHLRKIENSTKLNRWRTSAWASLLGASLTHFSAAFAYSVWTYVFIDVIAGANVEQWEKNETMLFSACLLYTSPSPRDQRGSRMPSSA